MSEEKLVRCRPCGYIMKESELGDVCPACGLPHTVFEPYREKVSAGRLKFLGLDIHPIAIHLSQTFVALIPGLIILNFLFGSWLLCDTVTTAFDNVIGFSLFVFPLTLIASFVSGIGDGYARFKTMKTPLLKKKIIYSVVILFLSGVQLAIYILTDYSHTWYLLLLSLLSLACAVKLGMMGKRLIDVIVPGTFSFAKKKPIKKPVSKSTATPKAE